uniref:Protein MICRORCHIDIA 6-like n=1 Tax=Nicotiana tabacum TaxID=4097 RepID=A0A1S3ZPW5_TOBAC
AYLSILYLKIPENFCIWLRGRIVEYHNIARDLKYPEFIVYKPQNGGCKEGSVITSIGFLKEAPLVNIHGFNVYHRNRLILPFWNVAGSSTARSRGVVGVLEANFIQPTHNKQDFEKTPLFQKLENRLKEMTWEYWDYHCGLIGYHATKRLRKPSQVSSESRQKHGTYHPIPLSKMSSVVTGAKVFSTTKRKDHDHSIEPEILKRKAGLRVNLTGPESIQNPMLFSKVPFHVLFLSFRCSEYEKMDEELNAKVTLLRKELKEAQREYGRLLIESGSLEYPKMESTVTL